MSLKVSVIIPYKEDRGYLDQAVASVERQTYRNFELIMSQGDCGVSENLNRGIEKATGDIIRYLCDDDLLPNDSLEHTVNGFGRYDWVHSKAINFRDADTCYIVDPANKNPDLKTMLDHNQIHGGTVAYHRRIFDKGFRFDESLWTGEEYDFNLNLLSKRYRLGFINEVTYLYRRHAQQKSLGNMANEYQNKRANEIQRIRGRYRFNS